jgi:hypothetical protein
VETNLSKAGCDGGKATLFTQTLGLILVDDGHCMSRLSGIQARQITFGAFDTALYDYFFKISKHIVLS